MRSTFAFVDSPSVSLTGVASRSWPAATAAQHVHVLLFNTRTEYLRSFEVHLRGPVQTANIEQHATSRVTCISRAPVSDERWIPMCDAMPFIPPTLPFAEVKAEAAVQELKGRTKRLEQGALASEKRRADEEPTKLDARPERKRRKPVRIKARSGVVVWDRNLMTPVAWVVRGHTREIQPRPNISCESTIVLRLERITVGPGGERLRSELERSGVMPAAECVERHISEMAEFTELLPEIWTRRLSLPPSERQETEAVVRAALIQRLKLAPHLSAAEMWAESMGDEPCPVDE